MKWDISNILLNCSAKYFWKMVIYYQKTVISKSNIGWEDERPSIIVSRVWIWHKLKMCSLPFFVAFHVLRHFYTLKIRWRIDSSMWISEVIGTDSATDNCESLRNLKPLSFFYRYHRVSSCFFIHYQRTLKASCQEIYTLEKREIERWW